MNPIQLLACLALLATTVISAWNDFTNLHPVLAPTYNLAELANIAPSSNVSLDYGLSTSMDSRSSVSIDLLANQPVVLLEAIGAVLQVACTPNTVTVNFGTGFAFARTISEWPRDEVFYLITNHPGNCNAIGERGIYKVTSLSWDNDAVAVTAQSEMTDFVSIASESNMMQRQQESC